MTWLIVERSSVKLFKPYYSKIKRLLDLLLCLAALPFVLPVGLLIALAVWLDSPGPIFFVQERIGKGGRAFRMFKFRSMDHSVDPASHAAVMQAFVAGRVEEGIELFKPFTNNQVTRVGRFLRKTSLDELPQLINILKGEMSLVGPRPNVPWEFEAYQGWHKERLEVVPGITGLAQVRGRSALHFDDIVRYDIEYIKKRSLLLDLQIFWETIVAVVRARGAH